MVRKYLNCSRETKRGNVVYHGVFSSAESISLLNCKEYQCNCCVRNCYWYVELSFFLGVRQCLTVRCDHFQGHDAASPAVCNTRSWCKSRCCHQEEHQHGASGDAGTR